MYMVCVWIPWVRDMYIIYIYIIYICGFCAFVVGHHRRPNRSLTITPLRPTRPQRKEYPVQVEGSDTVAQLKHKIRREAGLPAHHLILLHNCRLLEDGWCLAGQCIAPGSIVHMKIALRGGGTVRFCMLLV